MPPPLCTELAVLPLEEGVDVVRTGSEGHMVMQAVMAILSKQAGFQGASYGHQIENHANLNIAFDWNSIDDHKAFAGTEEHKSLVEKLKSIMAGPTIPHHVNFSPPFTALAGNAPVVDLLTVYFRKNVNEDEFNETWNTFCDIAKDKAEGSLGCTSGWIVEDLEHESIDGKAKGFAAAIGWESVEAHVKYRNTIVFKESIDAIRSAASGISMHHVKFTTA
ncbi:hypothetical protein EJ08DRAFT_698276 [Tothia fuscella]|uniref:ABM domain-containing protein n=1 Tax=Tothia fuscella TaxID=1048955 RepID=A0A9P4TXF4_9PEZI|nr:hypothetical protein EJ08DRAFT_698276 [Tothia fuscella]